MKYSVVVPIYNDGYLAATCAQEVRDVFCSILGTQHIAQEMELIFINDGSRNDSLSTLIGLCSTFDFVRVIELSRNFGQHQALAAGFHEARGEIVVRMNVDLQDSPSDLPLLLTALHEGDCDLVIGQYDTRQSPLKDRITSKIFFWMFKYLSGIEVPHNSSPMRAMSRRFINAYNQLTEKSRFPQGLDQWLGFKQHYVTIEHRERQDGKSSYTFRKRLALAMTGILYFSDRPILLVASFGFVAACAGFAVGLYVVAAKLGGATYLPGYTSIVAIGLLAFGIQLTALGLIGLYIGRIFREVQNRPLYLIRETYGKNH